MSTAPASTPAGSTGSTPASEMLRLCVMPGDGIGPELVNSALAVLQEACRVVGGHRALTSQHRYSTRAASRRHINIEAPAHLTTQLRAYRFGQALRAE
ncbi:hypothetical protein SAMN04488693_11319 [Arthrobacter subterraneus]|uniref:Isocitrate/isopropylmalate dehydrogenase n=1 Tax=Arthrobacter subterraneus TaxID=335973 RepID=A0A1G8L604_9MICC|nr:MULTISPECIES: hypothetical protein [Arthrobacter]SDI51116.1 hypothetical protein SAMN04488693_11319 [Arthrobacter subterraneus]